ncbi:MAG: DUF3501 family protein [Acidobacteria bacterium]|nr:DUF3501 family protein [Acidobacteriota bacterium]
MKPIRNDEIKSLGDYELMRAEVRPRLMAVKDRRRVRAGGSLTFLFENRDTVWYQIQEMLRIERLVKPEEIRHEVETYNELIPAAGELSACLLIEYESPGLRAVWLRKLLGLERHVRIEIEGAGRAQARFDDRQIATDRISAVQYVKFPLTAAQVRAFPRGAKIVIDHPEYPAETVLSAAQLAELAQDLA